ncbi:hypothetical protein LTS10_004154 [Elasticomyces elasticus]|nr:hypothetical protein LTS10_004154 [Elasticomyces elasticus]
MAPLQPTAAVAKLDELYHHPETVTATSSDADFNRLRLQHSQHARVSHNRQTSTPSRHQNLSQSYRIVSRRIQDGNTAVVFCQMSNRIDIMGDIVDPFQETAVVTFDGEERLVSKLKLYSCRSPLVRVMQEKTRLGPYSEEYMATDEQLPGMQEKHCLLWEVKQGVLGEMDARSRHFLNSIRSDGRV